VNLVTDEYTGTPLVLAAGAGKIRTMQLLLKHGAELGEYKFNSPLPRAVKNNKKEVLEFLLDNYDFDINCEHLKYCAEISGSGEMIDLLVAKGADFTNFEINFLTVAFGYFSVVKALINYGANANPKDGSLLTYAHTTEMIQLLIDNGANLHRGDPLAKAGDANSTQILNYLLEAGSNVEGTEAIYTFTKSNNIEAIKTLISAGANVDQVDSCDDAILRKVGGIVSHKGAALHLAASNNYLNIVEELINASANVNTLDSMKATPMFYAQLQHNNEVVSALEQAGGVLNINNSWCDSTDGLDFPETHFRDSYMHKLNITQDGIDAICVLTFEDTVELV
ncbi:MAG: ankyrin repeat domain-containing protein, partial [Pseudomonadota bacterium]